MRETRDSGGDSGWVIRGVDAKNETQGASAEVPYSFIMTRAFSTRYRWHRRFVPMTERPNVARMFTRKSAMFAVSDCTQFCPNAVAATRKFASH
jgi:hypothetical protein